MFDTSFFQKFVSFKDINLKKNNYNKEELFELLETFRFKYPFVYNVETTNLCNMRCIFCPRTNLMTRKIERMSLGLFSDAVGQIVTGMREQKNDWNQWRNFCVEKYGVLEDEMSENNFFLYIISKVLVLHGFGDPLLDKDIDKKVEICTKNDIKTYFSCNPANVNFDKIKKLFDSGIGYIKFSIDSLDENVMKKIRGKFSSNNCYNNIRKVIEIKEKGCYNNSIIVVTMIDTMQNENIEKEWAKIEKDFKDFGTYCYLKSQNTSWLGGEKKENKSIDWNEACLFPWYATTIKSNGDVASCSEDYNNDIILGNIKNESLYDIWNGDRYKDFRYSHLLGNRKDIKCFKRCEKKKMIDF